MGYNRAGTRRTARLRRAKREQDRLARKAADQPHGLVAKVKEAAKEVAGAVGSAVKPAVDAVRGKKEK